LNPATKKNQTPSIQNQHSDTNKEIPLHFNFSLEANIGRSSFYKLASKYNMFSFDGMNEVKFQIVV
jgi:hypothetical protein